MKINIGACSSDAERAGRINKKLKEDDRKEAEATGDAQKIIKEELEHLGYSHEEMGQDTVFEVNSGKHSGNCIADFLVKVNGRPLMAIKCTMSIDSRQRHALSLARSLGQEEVPVYAIVTDGLEARVFDTMTGKHISSDMMELPDRKKAEEILKSTPPAPYPEEKLSRERQILLAFETTLCPRPDSE